MSLLRHYLMSQKELFQKNIGYNLFLFHGR
nr:MAG TPA: hypothetical protein [Caudoviricetes sp.]